MIQCAVLTMDRQSITGCASNRTRFDDFRRRHAFRATVSTNLGLKKPCGRRSSNDFRGSPRLPAAWKTKLRGNPFIRYPVFPMDDQTPATKADIKALMDSIGGLYDRSERWKNEIMQHFDVVVENLRHDFIWANRDAIELLKDVRIDHEDRIMRLERHADIVA